MDRPGLFPTLVQDYEGAEEMRMQLDAEARGLRQRREDMEARGSQFMGRLGWAGLRSS